MKAPRQGDVQTVSQKGNEDIGLDARLELVKDRPDGQIAFEVLERLLDRHQQQVMAPQLGRVLFDEVGAQQIPAFAQSCLPEFVAIEPITEGGAVCSNLDRDQAPGGAGLIARGAEFHQQFLTRQPFIRSQCQTAQEGLSGSGPSLWVRYQETQTPFALLAALNPQPLSQKANGSQAPS